MKKIFTLILIFVAAGVYAQDSVNITFQVNTATIASVSGDGMYLAGGGIFGVPGDNPMTDANSDGTWEVTIRKPKGISGHYTFLNGNCPGWDCKEQLAGKPCGDASNFNDRILPTITSDTTIKTCFGECNSDGSCPSEPSAAPLDPTHAAENVISIYSESYSNPAGINYNPGWGQSTQYSVYEVGMDSMIKYSSLNYQGIDFGGDIDVSALEYLHMDVWTNDLDNLKIFPISRGGEKSVTVSLTKGNWTSVDILLSEFTDQGLSVTDLFQIKLEDPDAKSGTIYVDNILFYSIPAPAAAAADPTAKEEDVISIYSDTYMDVAGSNFYPNWGQSTQFMEDSIGNNKMLVYSNLNYQGMDFGSDVDASGMETLHLDVWSASVANLEVYPISRGSGEKQVTKTITANEWNSFEIPVSDYTSQSLTMNDLFQFKFVDPDGSAGTIYLDNIYFSKPETNSITETSFDRLKMYPNPVNEKLTLDINTNGVTINSFEILSSQGQVLSTRSIDNSMINETMDISNYASGIYFIKINTENGSLTQRFIKN